MTPKLWTLEEVAQFLSLGLTQARKATAQPDFPCPAKTFGRFRSPRWEPDAVQQWASSKKVDKPPVRMASPGETALYRHFDANGQLLYVGIATDHLRRLLAHVTTATWAREIARIDVVWFPTRAEAEEAELKSIIDECPRFNIKGRAA